MDRALSLLAVVNHRVEVLTSHAAEDHSVVTSHGMEVAVKSRFQVMDQIHFGALYHYEVRIRNVGADEPVQLVSRHWIIKDFEGHKHEVRRIHTRGEEDTNMR
eukprot:TRINITY_DN22480_c0_g1_i2.p1 TRINITY_DN22480_c0_g1~~TRINITY_DN22480_c0_g1_i2.p1  ORF type:complete len:121 (+),score=2.34 TRINITY_DN22480_c0_g1_i2:55-363(+)